MSVYEVQDPKGDGGGLRIEFLEHGGSEPDNFPTAIRVPDSEGWSRVMCRCVVTRA
jgi:hypothetical protein